MNALPPAPLLLPYEDHGPRLLGPLAAAGPGCAILGRVTLGAGAELRALAVLRGDGHDIGAGAGLFLGEGATVHIAHALQGTVIGTGVSVGANAVVHACTVGDGCVIGHDAVVLDGSVLEPGVVLAPGAVVFPRSRLPAGQWCEGSPAQPVRAVSARELAQCHANLREVASGSVPRARHPGPDDAACGYVAATVTGSGALRLAPGSSVWFGCVVDAAGPGVELACGANVQDNSVLRAVGQAIQVGRDTTVGHNVELHDCRIGAEVLVGMGSRLAPGTVVEDDVLLAAGSCTRPGQVLTGGWLWAGRPARKLVPMDARKRQGIQRAAEIYRGYADEFRRQETRLLPPDRDAARNARPQPGATR